MYQKLANKDLARKTARDNNLYSSEFFKFDLNKSQKEYLDLIEDREKFSGLLMNDEQYALVRKFNLDNLVSEMSNAVFELVLESTKKLDNKGIREQILSFVSDKNLFKRYTDYVYKYSTIVDVQ
jgi:hypothetical protein